jgi:hypothetical protein
MKKIKRVIYLTPDEIDQVIVERETEALEMVPGMGKQSALKEIHQLRSYATMKRLLAAPFP